MAAAGATSASLHHPSPGDVKNVDFSRETAGHPVDTTRRPAGHFMETHSSSCEVDHDGHSPVDTTIEAMI